jgi:two-component system NtrC family sensor kinase
VKRPNRSSWTLLLDWGGIAMTLLSASASAFAAIIAFRHDDTSAMAEAVLACGAALTAAWLGRSASRAMHSWQEELVAWHGNDIALLLDEHGRILDFNDRAADAYGQKLEERHACHLRDLIHPDAAYDLDALIAAILADRRALYETTHQHADGSPFPAEVSARLVEARGMKFLHFIVRDVTDSHRARERLVAAERLAAVGSVAAAMAHDINNPLCGVQGNITYALDVLGDPSPDLAEVRNALRDAQDSSRRVRDLVRDLNAFSNGFADVDSACDLQAVIAETVAGTSALVARRCLLLVDIPPLPRIAAPARRLSQAFTIIVRDAALAMPDGEPARHTIRISARPDGPLRVLVEVSDDGPPIHSDGPSGRVEPFHGQTPVVRSGGAGMTAVMGMVRAVGGDVVTEPAPGGGNAVRVHLPVAVMRPEQPASQSVTSRTRLGHSAQHFPAPRRARLPE